MVGGRTIDSRDHHHQRQRHRSASGGGWNERRKHQLQHDERKQRRTGVGAKTCDEKQCGAPCELCLDQHSAENEREHVQPDDIETEHTEHFVFSPCACEHESNH